MRRLAYSLLGHAPPSQPESARPSLVALKVQHAPRLVLLNALLARPPVRRHAPPNELHALRRLGLRGQLRPGKASHGIPSASLPQASLAPSGYRTRDLGQPRAEVSAAVSGAMDAPPVLPAPQGVAKAMAVPAPLEVKVVGKAWAADSATMAVASADRATVVATAAASAATATQPATAVAVVIVEVTGAAAATGAMAAEVPEVALAEDMAAAVGTAAAETAAAVGTAAAATAAAAVGTAAAAAAVGTAAAAETAAAADMAAAGTDLA